MICSYQIQFSWWCICYMCIHAFNTTYLRSVLNTGIAWSILQLQVEVRRQTDSKVCRRYSTAYRIAGYFCMVQIFVFFVCEPCIWKWNIRKFENCPTCYVGMRESTKIKHANISKNYFVLKFAPTKISCYTVCEICSCCLQSSNGALASWPSLDSRTCSCLKEWQLMQWYRVHTQIICSLHSLWF